MQNDVERFLSALRSSHPNMALIYKFGGCYRLYLLLRVCWPEAEAWWDQAHVYTKIGKLWYDIDGKHVSLPANVKPMTAQMQRRHVNWDNFVHVTLDEEFRMGQEREANGRAIRSSSNNRPQEKETAEASSAND